MNYWFRKLQYLAATLLLLVITACAGVSQTVSGHAFHSFSFDASRQSQGIEILFYRYGSANDFGLRTTQRDAVQGKSNQGVAITGDMPVGNELYFKWRNKTTGQIYEDTVDLKSRLPSSMYKQELHPIIEGSQLYVYLVSFEPVRPYFSDAEVAQLDSFIKTLRQKSLRMYSRQRVIQIYPIRVVDPHLPANFSK